MSQSASELVAARPASIEEAAEYLATASAEGRQVRIGDDLSTAGLDRVLEHEAGDLTCTVEAGIRLSALRDALAAAGQRLSLDPPGDPTVGACLARRLSGPLSHRFGTPRDLVLGVTLVLGDGTIASSGGKVVKNVAGYDLGKLVCGSEGRLALIARVSLRLHPLPASTATLVVETDTPADAVRALRRSQLQPSAVDVLHPGRVAVLFEGSAEVRRVADRPRRARSSAAPRRTVRPGTRAASVRAGRSAASGSRRAISGTSSRRSTRRSSGRRPASRTCRTASAGSPTPPLDGSTAR